MTVPSLSAVKHSLSTPILACRVLPPWRELLSGLHDDQCEILISAMDEYRNLSSRDREITPEEFDRLYKSLSSRYLREELSAEQRNALDSLSEQVRSCDIDPLEDPQILNRLATIVGTVSTPWEVVLDRFAEAAGSRQKSGLSYHRWFSDCHSALLDFRDNSDGPAQPRFNADEYSLMAAYVHNETLRGIRAVDPTRFFLNGSEFPRHAVDSLIDAALQGCSIRHPITGDRVFVSNKLVSEVRCSLARRWPLLSETHEGDTPFHPQAMLRNQLEIRLRLDRAAWTSSETIWKICGPLLPLGLSKEAFFKELGEWSNGTIRRTKKIVGGKRVPGYLGIGLIPESGRGDRGGQVKSP